MSDHEQDGVLDVEEIGRLMALMEQHNVNAVDLRHGSQRLRLRRGFPPVAAAAPASFAPPAYAPAAYAPPPPVAPGSPPAVQPSAAAPAAASEEGAHIVTINSPMVGTFYLRPKPDAEPYVKVADTRVCIIEAMKTFNEIPAGVSGVIAAILAKNEEPVDFDRPLFKVDTSR